MGFIEDKRFLKYGARCIFFNRFGGVSKPPFDSLNTSFSVKDKKSNVEKNLEIVKNEVEAADISLMNQIHSNNITEAEKGYTPDADGIYTHISGIFLGVKFADCIPIIFMDTKNRIIMSIHAGWRGSCLAISEQAVKKLILLGSKPNDIIVSIGPHICSSCYEVKEDVANKFNQKFIKQKSNKLFLDLESVNIEQIMNLHVPLNNIESTGICTYENRDFFSYRRDVVCGRNIGGIILNKNN